MAITVDASGSITVDGEQSMRVYRVLAIRSALSLWERTGLLPGRGITLSVMLGNASQFTGKTYPKSKRGAMAAQADLAALLPAPVTAGR